MPAPTCSLSPAPRHLARARGGLRHLVGLVLLAVTLLGAVPTAQAQEYRRRRQRDYASDGAYPAPAYGSAARGLARQRRRPTLPVRRRRLAPPKPKNDSGDAEAVEEIESDAAVTTSADGPETWWGDAWPILDRIMDVYTPRPVRPRTTNTLISHRSSIGILRDPLWNAFGVDGFSNVGLGVRVGIIDRLDLGIERWGGSSYDTYEFDVRGQILKQDTLSIDLGLRLGLSWFAQKGANDASGFFVELLAGRLLFNRVYVSTNFIYHTSSSGAAKTDIDVKSSAALQFAANWRINGGFALAVELTPSVAGYHLQYPDLTVGPRFITNRHTFTIVLSNTSYFSTDAIVTNSSKINPRDWKLGFHITREL